MDGSLIDKFLKNIHWMLVVLPKVKIVHTVGKRSSQDDEIEANCHNTITGVLRNLRITFR